MIKPERRKSPNQGKNVYHRITINRQNNDSSNSKDTTRLCRNAMDSPAATGPGHVLQLHLHGHPLSHQGPDAGDARLGLYRLWYDARLRGIPQRLRLLPHLRRYHPRQDGCSLHDGTLGYRHVHRRLHQVVCRERGVCRQRTGDMVYRQPQLHPRLRRAGRFSLLSGYARLG